MQRFSTWARWISVGLAVIVFIFKDVVLPVVVDFIKQQPETNNFLHAILKILLDLAQQSWVHVAAWILVGFVVGLWVDLFLRKLDGSRADTRADTIKLLGAELISLGEDIEELKFPMQQEGGKIRSCFARARKLGLWVPDERVFRLHPPRAAQEVSIYMRNVGALLKDGNFHEAKEYAAVNGKAAFDKAYAAHRLGP